MQRKVLVVLVAIVVIVSGVTAGVVLTNKGGGDDPPKPVGSRTARAWVDLTALGAGEVREQDRWGSVETFSGAATGTGPSGASYYRQVSLFQNPGTESVVLDGKVWCMVRSNVSNAVLLRYTPQVSEASWNLSFECYAPQGGDFFNPADGVQQVGLTATLTDALGRSLAAVDLSYGSPGCNYVRYRDPSTGGTTYMSDRVLPAFLDEDGAEGGVPARYIVSFQRVEGGACEVAVVHTSCGLVGKVTVDVPSGWTGPGQVVLSTTSSIITKRGVDPNVPDYVFIYSGGWVVDNVACRGATARYPVAGPLYEYAREGGQAPAFNATRSFHQGGAEVTIGGKRAAYNETTGRYEADLPMDVQWGKRTGYKVVMDGVTLSDELSLTMVPSAEHAHVAEWWNGWDWVSVFGEDDCSGPGTVRTSYQGYNHPLTAYNMGAGGSSQDVMTFPYVELASHYPHDWETGNTKFWGTAVSHASDGIKFLRNNYEFASRWDSPQYGGKGDTYISMANPGNKATYQQLYALSGAGIRIDGRSSDPTSGAPGNRTQVGSFYYPGGYLGTGSGWYPYTPIDLMDAARSLSWDNPQNWNSAFSLVDGVARDHGLLRVYGHPNRQIQIPGILHWIDDAKTNYSLENWKATDGEVASYIYGRWSTDLTFNAQRSSGSTWSYNVSCKDPSAAGYWKVPVTVAVDLGGKTVKDVIVQEGGKTKRASEGTLHDLDSNRIMDRGFNIRNGTLYVSDYWTGQSTLTVVFDDSPLPLAPVADMTSALVMRVA